MGQKLLFRLLLWGAMGSLAFFLFNTFKFSGEVSSWEGASYLPIPETTVSLMESGRWEKALDELFQLPEPYSENPDIFHHIARCYKELGIEAYTEKRFQDALVNFEDGLLHVEDDPGLLLCLGATLLTLSEYDRAETAYQKVLSADPDNIQALKELGQVHYLRNEPGDAETAWSRAARLDPGDEKLEKRLSKLRKELSAMDVLDVDGNMHFEISYDGTALPAFEYTILEIMEAAYHDLGSRLLIYPKRQISVMLLTKEAFYDITQSPEWSAGLYTGQIKIPVAGANPDDLKKILYHEYVHAVLFDQISDTIPWWLNEGLAQYLSGEEETLSGGRQFDEKEVSPPYDINIFEYRSVGHRECEDAARAYASALSAVSYLYRTYGETSARSIIGHMAEGETFESAFTAETWDSFEAFVTGWERYVTGETGFSK